MSKEDVRKWLVAALVRMVKTMAQALVAFIGAGTVGVLEVDWAQALGIAATMGILSLLTSLAGLPEVDEGTSPLKSPGTQE